MPRWLLEWFDAVGLPVYEAYGVSEDVVPVAMNRPGARRMGTVGKPLPPNEVRISDEGEILIRGPGVFSGYLSAGAGSQRPDAEDFWPTGDLGTLDAEGYLSVTGRKSDTFKTATGRWVSPARIEERLGRLPYVLHAVVVGAGRKAVAVLLSVDAPALRTRMKSGPPTRGAKSGWGEAEAAALGNDILEKCGGLASHEQPAAVLVTADPFTIAGGELTTNLKIRRKAIATKYAAAVDRLFAELERSGGMGQASSRILVRRA